MDTGGEGGCQVEEGGLSGMVGQGVLRWVPTGQEGYSRGSCGCKNPGAGGLRTDYGEGLLVDLRKVLANHQTAQKSKAGFRSGHVRQGRRTLDLD